MEPIIAISDLEMIRRWLVSLEADGATAGSVSGYEGDAKAFAAWLANRDTAIPAVTNSDIDAYLGDIGQQGLRPATANRHRAAIRSLFAYLAKAGMIERDPARHLVRSHVVESGIHVLPQKVVADLLDATHARVDAGSVRSRVRVGYARTAAIMETIYASGMKSAEIIALPCSVFDADLPTVSVGSGLNLREVMLTEKAKLALEKWWSMAFELNISSTKWAFHSLRNPEAPLTRAAIFYDINAAVEAFDPDLAVSPGTLRDCFAAHLIENGMPTVMVQKLLGLKDASSMEPYIEYVESQVAGVAAGSRAGIGAFSGFDEILND